jgi:hypothetical protein
MTAARRKGVVEAWYTITALRKKSRNDAVASVAPVYDDSCPNCRLLFGQAQAV